VSFRSGFSFSQFACTLGLLAVASTAAFGQSLNSTPATVTLHATLAESLTIAATPGNVAITLVPGGTSAPKAVNITTKWVLNPSRTNVSLYGYFTTATAALTDGATKPDNIPTANVLGQVANGLPTTYTAFTQTTPFGGAGAGLKLASTAITTGTNSAATQHNTLDLEINLTTHNQLPAGSYTGTLYLVAQAL
jgi:hypothetical protein